VSIKFVATKEVKVWGGHEREQWGANIEKKKGGPRTGGWRGKKTN